MIGIIDYGSGNVFALMNILKQKKISHILSSDPDELSQADRFILPGVGAFDPTMENLQQSGMVDFLNEQVLVQRKKALGICVGMHLLAESSEEGKLPGLGWIGGQIRKIDVSTLNKPPLLPHMGWNSIKTNDSSGLFKGVDNAQGFYFLHSYFFDASSASDIDATALYGSEIPCTVQVDNVYGVQFHPEKSHSNGVQLLENFSRLN